MATQHWYDGTIIKIQDETASTKRFWIQLSALDHFDFTPGQFVILDLPIHEEPKRRQRSYSIASAPDRINVFELVIVLMEGGAGTHFLFNDAKVGTSFPVRGPLGNFILPDPISSDIFMICTGTGIAPFRSMIQHIHHNNIPHKELYLIYGTRKRSDALYMEEFFDLKQKLPSFHYFPTFSREEMADEGFCIGYVHGVYEQLLQEKRDAPSFFLCGWKDMIHDARQKLQGMGIDRKSIHFELYG